MYGYGFRTSFIGHELLFNFFLLHVQLLLLCVRIASIAGAIYFTYYLFIILIYIIVKLSGFSLLCISAVSFACVSCSKNIIFIYILTTF